MCVQSQGEVTTFTHIKSLFKSSNKNVISELFKV